MRSTLAVLTVSLAIVLSGCAEKPTDTPEGAYRAFFGALVAIDAKQMYEFTDKSAPWTDFEAFSSVVYKSMAKIIEACGGVKSVTTELVEGTAEGSKARVRAITVLVQSEKPSCMSADMTSTMVKVDGKWVLKL